RLAVPGLEAARGAEARAPRRRAPGPPGLQHVDGPGVPADQRLPAALLPVPARRRRAGRVAGAPAPAGAGRPGRAGAALRPVAGLAHPLRPVPVEHLYPRGHTLQLDPAGGLADPVLLAARALLLVAPAAGRGGRGGLAAVPGRGARAVVAAVLPRVVPPFV